MNTRAIVKRLEAMEAAAASMPGPDAARRQAAVSALFDVLEARYPDDPLSAGMGRESTAEKVARAAQRIVEGMPSDVDGQALAALAACPAMSEVSFSAESYIAAVGAMLSGRATPAERLP